MNNYSGMLNDGIKIIVVLILFALTVLSSSMVSQYEISGDELLTNGSFENKLDNWHKSGDVSVVSINSKTVVRLESDDSQKIVSVRQTLGNIKKGQSVLFSGAMKTEGVSDGDKVWQAARIIFVAVDADGQSMYNVSHALVMRNGTTDWETYSKVFVAVSHAAHYYVELQLVNVTGVSLVKNLSLRPVGETLSFRFFQSVSALLWLIVTLWVLAPYWRTIFSSKENLLILIMLLAVLFASLASADLKHGFVESLKPFLPWVGDEAMLFRIGHFLAYGMISVAVFWKAQSGRAIITCLGLLIMFSMATEILQYLVDGRTPRISDFLVDVLGVISGFLISYMISALMKISLKREVG